LAGAQRHLFPVQLHGMGFQKAIGVKSPATAACQDKACENPAGDFLEHLCPRSFIVGFPPTLDPVPEKYPIATEQIT
jgi:hypothetical protein